MRERSGKVINQTERTTLLENSQLSGSYDSTKESFPFGYTNMVPSKDVVSKAEILKCRLHPWLLHSDEDRKLSTMSRCLQACMIHEGHCAYVFIDFDDLRT